jgi:hypothetical protein
MIFPSVIEMIKAAIAYEGGNLVILPKSFMCFHKKTLVVINMIKI